VPETTPFLPTSGNRIRAWGSRNCISESAKLFTSPSWIPRGEAEDSVDERLRCLLKA
jgi:hypothetical protein